MQYKFQLLFLDNNNCLNFESIKTNNIKRFYADFFVFLVYRQRRGRIAVIAHKSDIRRGRKQRGKRMKVYKHDVLSFFQLDNRFYSIQ